MSESWKGKSKGMRWGYQIFVAILRNFGVLTAYFLLRFVAFYYFIFSFKTTKPLFSYFHNRLGFSPFKSILKIYKSYYLIGQSIIDKVVMMSGIPNPFTFNFDGEENLQKMVDLKRGGLLISGHVGNWEIAGHLLKRLQTTINIVLFDGEREQIKEYLEGITGKRNVKMIVIKNDLSHIYAISDALANNELVCMLADRFVEGNKTLSTDFLGAKAHFPMGPFVLAAKFKVPISWVFSVKESPTHYHFFASEIQEYGHLKKDVIMQTMLNDFVAQLENKVKSYPEQWFNYYDFWKV
jgi:predicted LPLAT superfamily acyltransferase